MVKYKEIESGLLRLEGGMFQNICDEVIFDTEEGCDNIFGSGGQAETMKTKPGTPDTYFVLLREYVLVEYPTQDIGSTG